jgi:hypothetical protein
MYYERIVIEADDGGWVRFKRPRGYGDRHSQDSLEIRPGFTFEHVLAAVDATGWVVERNGERRIQEHIGCDQLARIVGEMLSYFDRPDEPNDVLRAIKDQVAARLGDDDADIPLWAYAWLDLVLREEVADAARSASTLWQQDHLTIEVGQLRDERVRALCRRYAEAQEKPAAQTTAGSAMTGSAMTGSARTRDAAIVPGRSAG